MNASLYYFNPGHENALQNSSPYYTSPANVVKMQNDLAFLSAWYANEDDYVLINEKLPYDFILELKRLNKIAKGVTDIELKKYISTIDHIHLWGGSPQAIYKFKQINKLLSSNLKYPLWSDSLIRLSSRETAKDCLQFLIENLSNIDINIIPAFYDNIEDIEYHTKSTNKQLIVKAPYSSSGRGILWLPIGYLNRTEKQIIGGMLKKQHCVSVEEVLDKVVDFAMEFKLSDTGKCSFTAYSLFYTTNKGSYSHNYIGSQQNIIDNLNLFIDKKDLDDVIILLIKYLESHFSNIYIGCIGVDMMIYREKNKYYLHPCVEINVRDNMGLVAYSIFNNHIDSNSEGYFYIDYKNREGEQIIENDKMTKKYPLIIENKKIKSGYLSLCPIQPNSKYRAYILIKSIC